MVRIKGPVEEIAKRTIDLENALNKLGENIVKTWDFVHRSNFSNVVLAYLFAQGVSSFRFDQVIMFSPTYHVAFLTTDKGYYVVEVKTENEMTTISAERLTYDKYVQRVHDYIILLSEQVPDSMKAEVRKLAERWTL